MYIYIYIGLHSFLVHFGNVSHLGVEPIVKHKTSIIINLHISVRGGWFLHLLLKSGWKIEQDPLLLWEGY